ncbi:MAG: dihydrofolate reductase family protein [Ectothiorhodospiraceae bacterium]|nr:dihydrofolate reductase family protein [Ectothiorhodospiraceae bacterium]
MTVDYQAPVQRILPEPGAPQPLQGLYLGADLPDSGRYGPFVYANFVTTLDGRISLAGENSGTESVPASIADPRDWRLFQELAARADVLITSGRYFRDLTAGAAQDVLPVGSGEAFADLRAWRRARGMFHQPDVVVLSASLNFQPPEALVAQGRRIRVLTTEDAPEERVQRLEDTGLQVIRLCPGPRVAGERAIRAVGELGYRRVYSITGARVFHSLVAARAVDALFLTWRQRVVGGQTFSTITSGAALNPPADFRMRWMYRDLAPGSADQFFLCLQPAAE